MTIRTDALIEERFNQVYDDLINYIKWLAAKFDQHHWFMNRDDLISEGLMKLWELVQKYIAKPYPEFLRLAKTSLSNWFKTLLSKSKCEKRIDDYAIESLEDTTSIKSDMRMSRGWVEEYLEGTSLSEYMALISKDPEQVTISFQTYYEHIQQFQPFDRRVLDCLTGKNPRVAIYLDLAIKRRNWVYKDPSISITPLIISRALCTDVKTVKASFARMAAMVEK